MSELNETIKAIKDAIKNDIYIVEIKRAFVLCLSLNAFFLATKQLRAVGTPVVVSDIQIIKKLNTM
jgi:voltage-gated potassium channel Kch